MMTAHRVEDDAAELETAEAALFRALNVEVETRWVDVPELEDANHGGPSRVRVLSAGHGEPILCIHGSPNSAAAWAQLVAAMPERRFMLLERPGSGLSGAVHWTDHRRQAVAVMSRVLDAFDVASTDAVGSSFGGIYAYYLALDAAPRVRKLVQLGAPGAASGLPMPFVFRLMCLPGAASFMRGAFKPTVEGARAGWRELGHGSSVDANRIPEELFRWYAALIAHGQVIPGTIAETRAIATPFGYRPRVVPTAEELAALTCPVLYVWGEHDNFAAPAEGRRLAALTPGAQFRELEGAGHLPWCDRPDQVAQWLRNL